MSTVFFHCVTSINRLHGRCLRITLREEIFAGRNFCGTYFCGIYFCVFGPYPQK